MHHDLDVDMLIKKQLSKLRHYYLSDPDFSILCTKYLSGVEEKYSDLLVCDSKDLVNFCRGIENYFLPIPEKDFHDQFYLCGIQAAKEKRGMLPINIILKISSFSPINQINFEIVPYKYI